MKHPLGARLRGEGGEVTSTVFVLPVVLTLILVVVQLALAWHAKTLVDAAASDGLIATQVDRGSPAAGRDAANRLLSSSTNALLTDVHIDARREATSSQVTIDARVTNVVPLLPIVVHAVAQGPTERFRSDGEQ
jgi:hypothetical protein